MNLVSWYGKGYIAKHTCDLNKNMYYIGYDTCFHII